MSPFGSGSQFYPVPRQERSFGLFEEAVLWQADSVGRAMGLNAGDPTAPVTRLAGAVTYPTPVRLAAGVTYLLLLTRARPANQLLIEGGTDNLIGGPESQLTGVLSGDWLRIAQFEQDLFQKFGEPFPFLANWLGPAATALPPSQSHNNLLSELWTGGGNTAFYSANGTLLTSRAFQTDPSNLTTHIPVYFYPYNPRTGQLDRRNGVLWGRNYIAFRITTSDGSRGIAGITGANTPAGIHLPDVFLSYDASLSVQYPEVRSGPLPGVTLNGDLFLRTVETYPALPSIGWEQIEDTETKSVRSLPVTGYLRLEARAYAPGLDETALDGWWTIQNVNFTLADTPGNEMRGLHRANVTLVTPFDGPFDALIRRRYPVLPS